MTHIYDDGQESKFTVPINQNKILREETDNIH